MKKIFFILSLLFVFTGTTIAQESTVNKTKKSIAEVLSDAGNTVNNTVETVYEDGKSIVETIYGDAKEVIQYATPKIEQALIEIGRALKVGAEEVFEILVIQQIVYALKYLLIGIICVLFILWFKNTITKLSVDKKIDEPDIAVEKNDDLSKSIAILLTILFQMGVILTTAIIFVSNLSIMLTGFVNPKYGALMEIIEYTKTLL